MVFKEFLIPEFPINITIKELISFIDSAYAANYNVAWKRGYDEMVKRMKMMGCYNVVYNAIDMEVTKTPKLWKLKGKILTKCFTKPQYVKAFVDSDMDALVRKYLLVGDDTPKNAEALNTILSSVKDVSIVKDMIRKGWIAHDISYQIANCDFWDFYNIRYGFVDGLKVLMDRYVNDLSSSTATIKDVLQTRVLYAETLTKEVENPVNIEKSFDSLLKEREVFIQPTEKAWLDPLEANTVPKKCNQIDLPVLTKVFQEFYNPSEVGFEVSASMNEKGDIDINIVSESSKNKVVLFDNVKMDWQKINKWILEQTSNASFATLCAKKIKHIDDLKKPNDDLSTQNNQIELLFRKHNTPPTPYVPVV